MQIKEILESKYNLSQKNSELLISHLEQVTYSKKEIIQKADTMDYYIYFVESGLIRSFISRDGREITLWIVPEGGTPISSSRLTKPGISKILLLPFAIAAWPSIPKEDVPFVTKISPFFT